MEMKIKTGVRLHRVPGTSLYVNNPPGDVAYRSEYTTFCFLAHTADARDSLTLVETGALNGTYAFARERDGVWQELQLLLSGYTRGKTVLWTTDWVTADHVLGLSGSNTSMEFTLPFDELNAPQTVSLSVRVPQGAGFSLEDACLVLDHADSAFLFSSEGFYDEAKVEDRKVRFITEPGPDCGAVRCGLDGSGGARLTDMLAPEVRYMIQDGWGSLHPARLLADTAVLTSDVPVEISLNRDSLHRGRSRISFADRASRLMLNMPDTAGRGVMVTPHAGAAIYFDVSASAYASLEGRFQLAQGDAFDADGSTREVIVGASATEFFQLRKGEFDGLEFVAGKAATVTPPQDVTAGGLDSSMATTSWIRPCSTKAGFDGDSYYSYVAQPQDQPMYRPVADSAGTMLLGFEPNPWPVASGTAMPFLPLQGVESGAVARTHELDRAVLAEARVQLASSGRPVTLPALADQDTHWLTTPQGLVVEVDRQGQWHRFKLGDANTGLLEIARPKDAGDNPVRRWAIQEALSRPEVFTVLTPRSVDGAPAPDAPVVGPMRLSLGLSEWGLKARVAIGPDSLAPDPFRRNHGYDAKPGSAFAPVIIFKLSHGRLEELVRNPSRWGLGPVFNDSLQLASASAAGALENLKQLGDGFSPNPSGEGNRTIPPEAKKQYSALYKRITEPGWTGVLVFNAHAPFDEMPDKVKGLAEELKNEAETETGGGTPDDRRDSFLVPVVGIDLSKVGIGTGGGLNLERTSVFAGIHYHSPAPLPDGTSQDSFAFKLNSLNAIFDNTELRTFVAAMQLRLGSFFGTETSATKPGDQLINIHGSYERKAGNNAENAYVFRALTRRTIKFRNNRFLSHITVARVDVSSRVIIADNRVDKKVESRFALGGEIGFAKTFTDVTSVRTVSFGSAALIMSGKDFAVDVGDIRVALAERDTAGDGLLAKFPLQLSALRWSGFSIGSAKPHPPSTLAGAGFTHLDVPLVETGELFDFAAEFELNLGSLGKLAEKLQFLKARVMVGWTDSGRGSGHKEPAFCTGFRFDGGSGPLDIAIEDVFRLRAEQVSLKQYVSPGPEGFGIGLRRPQLEVMGYEIPEKPDDTLLVFIPKEDPDAKPPVSGTELAWAWVRGDTTVGPIRLDFFAIAQRIRMVDEALPVQAGLPDLIKSAERTLTPEHPAGGIRLPDIGKLYKPDAGWGIIASGGIGGLKLRLAFLDGIGRYGLGLDIPALGSIDVTYRKVGDGIGVFAGNIIPGFRSLEMGAANVTLPIIGFEAYTNGNWSVNIGYNGNDFSRGTTVQAFPFIGSGGIRFGKLDWRTSYVLNSPGARTELYRQLNLDPVIEMSFAFRIGVGREYEEGVFRAGFTVSVYGIFEGAMGKPGDPRFPKKYPSRYLRLSGRGGVLIELYGAVNFALVSAIVHIRTWMEIGLLLETWVPITFSATIGVRVSVRFVIARFRVFGKKYEIAVTYRFKTTIRAEFRLKQTFDGEIPDVYHEYVRHTFLPGTPPDELAKIRATPLRWLPHRSAEPRRRIPVGVTFDAMIADGKPVIVPMLLALQVGDRIPGLDDFCLDLFRWALRLSTGVAPDGQDHADVSLEDIETLASRITPPAGVSLARWGDAGLDHATLAAFFEDRIELVLQDRQQFKAAELAFWQEFALDGADQAEHLSPKGVMLPWFADIGIGLARTGGTVEPLRNFRGKHATGVSAEWEKSLFVMLRRAAPDYPEPETSARKRENIMHGMLAVRSDTKQALDVVVEDWATALVQGIVQRAKAILVGDQTKDNPNPNPRKPVKDLLAALTASDSGSPCVQTAQHAATFLHHGLRVPPADGSGAALALPELLQTQITLAELASHGDSCILAFAPLPEFHGQWLTGGAVLPDFSAAEAAKALEGARKKLGARLTVVLDDDLPSANDVRRFAAGTLVPLTVHGAGAPSLFMAGIPKALSRLAAGRPPAGGVDVRTYQLSDNPEMNYEGAPLSGRWAVKIDLRVRPFAAGVSAAGVAAGPRTYEILGVDSRVRDLRAWLRGRPEQWAGVQVRLVYAADVRWSGTTEAARPPVCVEDHDARFYVSNLSTEDAPPRADLLADGPPGFPTFATLRDAANLAEILFMASRVNMPGYSLAFPGHDPLSGASADGQPLVLSLVFDVGASSGKLNGLIDGLLLEAGGVTVESTIGFKTPGIMEARTCAPDGLVAIHVTRDNPMHRPAPEDSPEADAQALSAQYELVDYWALPGSEVSLPRECVVPVRMQVEEKDMDQAADEPEQWHYRLSLPVAKLAAEKRRELAVEAGIAPPDDAAPDPYALVGLDLKDLVQVGLRDAAGHLMPGKTDITWQTSRILYRDIIPTLDELPGISFGWSAGRTGGQAGLQLMLAWTMNGLSDPSSARDLPDDERVEAERLKAERMKEWKAQYWKYRQMMAAGDFEARLSVGLGGQELGSAGIRSQLVDWMGLIIAELDRTGSDPVPLVCAPIEVRLDLSRLPQHTPTPQALRVKLELFRRPDLCPRAETHPGVQRSETGVGPLSGTEKGVDWTALLSVVTSIFGERFVLLRQVDTRTHDAVWLMNASMMPKTALRIAQPAFFAPAPLARSFRSGRVAVGRLDQEPEQVDVEEVDLNALASRAAATVEALLRPDTGSVLGRIDPDLYKRLTGVKRAMADAMVAQLAGVVGGQEPDLPRASREKFLNACRADTGTAFAPAVLVTMRQETAGSPNTYLYGSIGLLNADLEEDRLLYSVSPVRVPLGTSGPCGSFDFVVRWTAASRDSVPALSGDMYFAPQYVEVRGEGEKDDGKPSDWFEIVWPATAPETRRVGIVRAQTGKAAWSIPLPLREVPPSPVILHQKLLDSRSTGEQSSLADFIGQARSWRYRLTFATPGTPHDIARATVLFSDGVETLAGDATGLFEALVAFGYHENALQRLVSALRDGGAGIDRYLAMHQIGILEAVARELGTLPHAAPASALTTEEMRVITLDARSRKTADGTEMWQLGWKVEPPAAGGTVSARLVEQAATLTGEDTELTPDAGDDAHAYAEYRAAGAAANAITGQAGLSARCITIAGLDVLRQARASATLLATRNARSGNTGEAISCRFIFETPVAGTAEVLTPRLAHDDVFDITTGDPETKQVSEWIGLLVDTLFSNAERALYSFDLAARLRMRLAGPDEDTTGNERVDVRYPLSAIRGVVAGSENAQVAQKEFSKAVAAHLANVPAGARESARLELIVHVYSVTGDQPHKPVLSLTGLHVPLNKIV